MEFKERLEYVLVPLGLLVFLFYHIWLVYNIIHNPLRTVIGLNAESRHQWVLAMMSDPMKNGVLAVQTIRNNIMASTLLSTTAITLSSLIGIFASSTWNSDDTPFVPYQTHFCHHLLPCCIFMQCAVYKILLPCQLLNHCTNTQRQKRAHGIYC